MASESELKMYNEIINSGCCKRCSLRYLGYPRELVTFCDPDTSLSNFGFISSLDEWLDRNKNKKKKNNPCTVCLDLLDNATLDQMLSDTKLDNIDEYKIESFVAYITFPTCILIREHSMKLYLKKTFPEQFNEEKVLKLNQAWRYSVEERLIKKLKKRYDHLSKLSLHFYTDYYLDHDEVQTIRNISINGQMSKHAVINLLNSVSDETFNRVVKSPPRIPFYSVQYSDLKYFSENIYLTGNFCKYSRELPLLPSRENSQIEGNSNSIQSIILNALKNNLDGDSKNIIFTASSFDEEQSRVLGFGRTFQLQLTDPKFSSISKHQLKKIERAIRKSNVVEVHKLREADRRDIKATMETEQICPRSFKLLCIVYNDKDVNHCVNAINMYSKITIFQKTPLRLLASRDNKWKEKQILFIRARKVGNQNRFIEIDMTTERSFYIPEFVCGDFGRTRPSLGDLINAKVELLALDLVDFYS